MTLTVGDKISIYCDIKNLETQKALGKLKQQRPQRRQLPQSIFSLPLFMIFFLNEKANNQRAEGTNIPQTALPKEPSPLLFLCAWRGGPSDITQHHHVPQLMASPDTSLARSCFNNNAFFNP